MGVIKGTKSGSFCLSTFCFFFFVSVFLTIEPKAVFAEIIKVSQSEALQIEIRNANDGDIIELHGGPFVGNVTIDKSLTIRGAAGDRPQWDFIRIEEKEEPKADPGGIKIIADDVKLTIEHLHLHTIKNLDTINLNSDSQKNATLNINDCLFTSEEGSWPSIYAEKAVVTITESSFKDIKTFSIYAETGCDLTLKNVKFDGGGSKYPLIQIEKSIVDLSDCEFNNVYGMCLVLSGKTKDIRKNTINNCTFNNCGKSSYPAVWIKDKAESSLKKCVFKENSGVSILLENKGVLEIEGNNEFYGKTKSNKPLVEIINSGLTIKGSESEELTTKFYNIEKYGILLKKGKFVANNCLFQGNPQKATFIEGKEKSEIIINGCEFGENKVCINIEDGKKVNIKDSTFGKSLANSINIKKTSVKDNTEIIGSIFKGAGNSCVKIGEKSMLAVKDCSFEGPELKQACFDVNNYSHVTITDCGFKNINVSCIKAEKNSEINVKDCRFNSNNSESDYAIQIDNKSIVKLVNCTFDWANNKMISATDCKDVKIDGIYTKPEN